MTDTLGSDRVLRNDGALRHDGALRRDGGLRSDGALGPDGSGRGRIGRLFDRIPSGETAIAGVALPADVAAATFVAATPWLRAYRAGGTTLMLALASVLPVAIVVVAARVLRWPPALSFGASALGFVVLVFGGAGLHPAAVWHGIAGGPNRLLTETLPLVGPRAELGGALLLTWLCGSASAELVVRARRDQPGLAAAGLAIPALCGVLTYAATSSAPGRDLIEGALLLGLLALGAALRHALGRPSALPGDTTSRSPLRGVAAGALVAVALAALLAAAVPSLPGMSRTPASLARSAGLANQTVVDPLDAMAALRNANARGRAQTALRVTLGEASTGYLGMAVLDDYDGAIWSFDTTFHPTGGRVPDPSALTATIDNASIAQRYTVTTSLPIPLLPALDRPLVVSGMDALSDATTGMLIPARPVGVPYSYAVESDTPSVSLASVTPADGIGGQGLTIPATDSALPQGTSSAMATAMRFLSDITGRRPAPTVAFLQAVMSALHADERRIDPSLAPSGKVPAKSRTPRRGTSAPASTPPAAHPGGTSLSEVINAVTVDRAATPEQFATLFAMVARYLGVPARVVTGFRVPATSAGAAVPAGDYTVTDRQAWAWVEVPVAGVGWVVADPTPDRATGVSTPPPEQVQATATTLPPPQANAVPRGDILGGHALAPPTQLKASSSSQLPAWLAALLVVVGLAMLVLLAGPGLATARRWFRRRARRSADPGRLAVGAWHELLDGLNRAGMSTPPDETSHEVATSAARHFGDELRAPILAVGDTAGVALYSSGTPDGARAAAAWQEQRRITRSVFTGLDRRQRARALVTVGSAPRRPERRPR